MIGIKACGVYVPLWRLDLAAANEGWRGEKAVGNFDEDSLTMGVAAAINCLQGIDRKTVDGIYFASTTFPYREKSAAVIAATALDMRKDIVTLDVANTLRAGTAALKLAADTLAAGTAKQILVIASDMRIPMPGSDFERELGDGAAAFLLSSDGARVAIEGSFSVADEIFDIWRADEDRYLRSWEDRFNIDEGYSKVLPDAITGIMTSKKLAAKDFARAVFSGPSARRHGEMGESLGFVKEQLQPPTFGQVGDSGASFSLLMLTEALRKSKAGERVLLANYGNGADAFVLKVQDNIDVTPSLQSYIASKIVIKDYKRYLNWRGLVQMVTGRRRPPLPNPSVTCLWREREQNLPLKGVKCKSCGTVQFPIQQICINCHGEQFEPVRLSDKKGVLATFTEDFATPTANPPLVLSVVDFEGGGRIWAQMTDRGSQQPLKVGMPLQMTFRKLFTSEGIHNYYWKSMPIRF